MSDDSEDEGEALGAPSTAKTLENADDVFELLDELVKEQLEYAREISAERNVAVKGDSVVRFLFLTLLADAEQRAFFLKTASNRDAFQRMRSFFGTPPFSFLRPGDAVMLRAGGFGRRRQHMAADSAIPPSSNFGAHALDEFQRQYRLPQTPFGGLEAQLGSVVNAVVKIKKITKFKKRELLKEGQKRYLTFPAPGEVVAIRAVPRLKRLLKLGEEEISLKVIQLHPRSKGARTAAVTLKLV